MNLTMRKVKKVLNERFGGLLREGGHDPDGEVCVRELRSQCLGMVWTDRPDKDWDDESLTDEYCQIFNDMSWGSDEERTVNCLPLAMLSEKDATKGWKRKFNDWVRRSLFPDFVISLAEQFPDRSKDLKALAKQCRMKWTRKTKRAVEKESEKFSFYDDALIESIFFRVATISNHDKINPTIAVEKMFKQTNDVKILTRAIKVFIKCQQGKEVLK